MNGDYFYIALPRKKLAFDPLLRNEKDWGVEDHPTRICGPLTKEEHLFLNENEFGKEREMVWGNVKKK